MLNKIKKQLLKERWYLIYMICHTILIAMLTRKIWVIVFCVLLMYIIRGFMNIVYMVNGVESYVPSKSFGPFFFPGDEQYLHIPGFRFRIRLSPATYDGIGVMIAFLAYLASMLMICFNEERSSSVVIANAVFLGAGLGSLKDGARASCDYQKNNRNWMSTVRKKGYWFINFRYELFCVPKMNRKMERNDLRCILNGTHVS